MLNYPVSHKFISVCKSFFTAYIFIICEW